MLNFVKLASNITFILWTEKSKEHARIFSHDNTNYLHAKNRFLNVLQKHKINVLKFK